MLDGAAMSFMKNTSNNANMIGPCLGELQWYVVKMRPPANPSRRTTLLNAKYETYKNRQGLCCKRPIRNTGKREFVSEVILKRAGFEVFIPVKKELRRKSRCSNEQHLVTLPLLVNWAFVGWSKDQSRWHELMALNSVSGVMAHNGLPVQLAEWQIAKLMRRYGGSRLTGQQRGYVREHLDYEVGDMVSVNHGSFEGFDVSVVDISRPIVTGVMNLLGRDVPVELNENQVSKR